MTSLELLSDKDLIARCRARESAAWAVLVERYRNYVWAIAIRAYRLPESDAETFSRTSLRASSGGSATSATTARCGRGSGRRPAAPAWTACARRRVSGRSRAG